MILKQYTACKISFLAIACTTAFEILMERKMHVIIEDGAVVME